MEFSHIVFRDSSVGRQAYVQGSNLAVWEVVMVARGYNMDPARTAEHLEWPMLRVKAAFKYAESYREEIEQAIEDNDSYGFDEITRMLPGTEIFVADGSKTAAAKGQNKENLSPTAS